MIQMSEKPVVSVVIPVYNAGKYLRKCLDSLRNQTLQDFEVICVDDGSTDEYLKIIEEYAGIDPRFKVFSQVHAYAGAARNLGIGRAKGKYLQFLDADDFFDPEMFSKTVGQAEKTAADICVFPAEMFDDRTGKVTLMTWTCSRGADQAEIFSRKDDPDKIFCFTTPAPWNKLFLRQFILDLKLEFQNTRSVNDLAFVLTALAMASRITTVNQPLLRYRVNNTSSLQGSQEKAPLAFYEALLELRRRLMEREVYGETEKAFLNQAAGDVFYNLHTLKTTAAFESTYFFIKNTALAELGLTDRPSGFFFILPDWQLEERIRVMREESILDYVCRFRVNLPELRKTALQRMGWKDFAKILIEKFSLKNT